MVKESIAGGVKMTQGTADDALFLSGSLALDLVNTEQVVRGKWHEVLSSPDELARWWPEALARHPEREHVQGEERVSDWTPDLLEEVKKARRVLRTLCTHLVEEPVVPEEDLEALNQMLALGYPSLQQTAQGTMAAVYRAHDAQKGVLLLSVALSALRLLTEGERERLHKCRNERCILFFYDTTKSGTRQWCSLGCMNRSRSSEHYRQIKGQKQSVEA